MLPVLLYKVQKISQKLHKNVKFHCKIKILPRKRPKYFQREDKNLLIYMTKISQDFTERSTC